MKNKKVLIIGSGIAGLSAGCYLQLNGYDTEIFELHDKAGGLCTSWKRKEYTFDGCIHSIGGLNPKFRSYQYWNELIDLDKISFYHYDYLAVYENKDGKVVKFYTDPDKLFDELMRVAPEDEKLIKSLIKGIKRISKLDPIPKKPLELWNPLDYCLNPLKVSLYLKYLIKYNGSMDNITSKCKNSFLKDILSQEFYSRFPAIFFLISLGNFYNKNSGYPIGGSLQFIKQLEKKFLEAGGKFHFNSKISKINIKDGKAIGITTENGEVYNDADIVISAVDGHYTIYEMLEGKFINNKIEKLYNEHPIWPSSVVVFLGISKSFENEPYALSLELQNPLVVDEQTKFDWLTAQIYSYDPTLAPKGKTFFRAILETYNYQYWSELRKNNKSEYQKQKDRIAKKVIEILDKRLGNIANNIDVVDVVTPATFNRYTNNWKGSIGGWEWLPRLIPETVSKNINGLKNFYMIGQWAFSYGGINASFVSGRDIAQIICEKDKKKFMLK